MPNTVSLPTYYFDPVKPPGPNWIQRERLAGGARFRRAWGINTVGSLFRGPPPLNLDTGPLWVPPGVPYEQLFWRYRSIMMDVPRLRTSDSAGQRGAVVVVSVGTASGDGAVRKVALGIQPVYMGLGQYDEADIAVERIWGGGGAGADAQNLYVRVTWLDEVARTGGSAYYAPSPLIIWAAGLPETAVPDGAREIETQNAVTIVWTDYSSGSAQTYTDTLAGGDRTTTKGQTFQTVTVAGRVRFWLDPL